jgi:hypothetical protein
MGSERRGLAILHAVHVIEGGRRAITAGLVMSERPPLPPLPRSFFLLFAVVYLYAFPFFEQLRSANEMPRILMTQEMVDRGVFYLDRRLSEFGSTGDLSRGPDGHLYPNKAPGPSFLAVPAYLICKKLGFTSLRAVTWAFRLSAVTLPALLFLPVFYRVTRRFSSEEPARRTALAAYALGSTALPYGILFFSHQVAAACAGTAFATAAALARRDARHPEDAAAATGFFAGLAVMMDYQAALASIIVGIYVLVRARRRLRNVILMAAGALPPAAALGMYHFVAFGSPLKTGYSYSFDLVTRQGFMGMVGPSRESTMSTLFLPGNGIFVLMPWILLAIVGGVSIARDRELRRRAGAEAMVASLVFLVYVAYLSSLVPYMARGGWCVGPRYLTTCMPFVGWLAAAGFAAADRRWLTGVAAQALVVVGAVIYLVAITTYPHWPDSLANPLYELSFRLLRNGYAVHSLGTALGLRGIWAALPLYLVAAALLLWLLARGPRRSWPAALLACVLGAGIVHGYRAFPRSGAYADRAWGFVTRTWEPKSAIKPL